MSSKRVACVTGAASGIGLGIARKLAEDGFSVVVADIKEPEAVDVMSGLPGDGHIYVRCDISRPEDRRSLIDCIASTFGRLDVHVNNAGIAPRERADILDTTEESYDRLMEVNLKGPFFLTQLVARYMLDLRTSGTVEAPMIVNISSMSAYTSSVSRAEYCISKAGVSMMTQLFAVRLAEEGINVYEIRPGIIQTPMTSVVQDKYNKLILEDGLLPIRRWGHPDDIARAVSAIASGAFPYSTGQVIDVDGGFHLRSL